jgi:hypothetical protein
LIGSDKEVAHVQSSTDRPEKAPLHPGCTPLAERSTPPRADASSEAQPDLRKESNTMKRVCAIAALAVSALLLMASAASAATMINPANAPSGTHLQSGAIGCTVGGDGLTVSCTAFELGGVGNTNAFVSLTAEYSGVVDCRNRGGNIVESHETTFSATNEQTLTPMRNGRLRVGPRSVSPDLDLAEPCPNPRWTPEFHAGSPTLDSFTYTLTFAGFTGAYITITGP